MKIEKIDEIAKSKWLALKRATYLDKNDNSQTWQYVERIGNPKIVTLIVKEKKSGKILLIKQPRVPIQIDCIEFPAGLVDEGESLEKAALRELKEETGYDAEIISISPHLPKSAGLTNEATVIVVCVTEEGGKGDSSMETTEDITHMWIHPKDFFSEIDFQNSKVAIDVYAWMIGFRTASEY